MKMIRFLLLAFLAVLVVSCKDDEGLDPVLKFSADSSTITVNASQTTLAVNVIANFTDWDVDIIFPTADEWISAQKEASDVVFTIAPNTTLANKSVKVKLQSTDGALVDEITITQLATDATLSITSEAKVMWSSYHETSTTFTVNSNASWTVSADAPWVSFDVTEGEAGATDVTVSYDVNNQNPRRRAVVTVESDGLKETQIIIQRGKKTHDDVTHYVYTFYASLPPLYGGLHMLSHNKPSVLFDGRGALTAGLYFPPHVTLLSNGNTVVEDALAFIDEVNKEFPDAVFGLCAGDSRVFNGIAWFSYLGIDTSRVKITLFPDGTGSYAGFFYNQYGASGSGEANYKAMQATVEAAYSKTDYTLADLPWDPYTISSLWPHIAASYSNVRYYLQSPDYLITNDAYVKSQIQNNNYIFKSPDKFVSDLPLAAQDQFFKMLNLNRATYDELFDASPKKNLIIIGTNTTSSGPANQRAYVQKVIDLYGSTYDIFFKAHPSDPDYVDYETLFAAGGLKLILPARMPFEAFCWALADKIDAVGGFNSTVFITVPLEKVKFMFAANSSSLGIPLSIIMEGLAGVDWITLP